MVIYTHSDFFSVYWRKLESHIEIVLLKCGKYTHVLREIKGTVFRVQCFSLPWLMFSQKRFDLNQHSYHLRFLSPYFSYYLFCNRCLLHVFATVFGPNKNFLERRWDKKTDHQYKCTLSGTLTYRYSFTF